MNNGSKLAEKDEAADALVQSDGASVAELGLDDQPGAEGLFPTVGIGASAGGLAALKRLFSRVPPDCGLAFVVVVHLSPEHESLLEQLLQPHTAMPVRQVQQTVALEPNHVYVIAPNTNLDSIDSHLRLTPLESRRHDRAPIDHFFRTLAESHGRHAIGVVLSGSGSDGTLGLRRIKERGGLTVVQDPDEAEHDGMPRSAIAAAPVDLVLSLDDIAGAVLRFAHTKPALEVPLDEDEASPKVRQLLQSVFTQIRARTGRDFSHYKRSTILRRIARRMRFSQVREPTEYVAMLRKRPEEVQALADDLLITVTSFFRDPEVFEMLAKKVIPGLFADRDPDDAIRVWSVGCATGEEAYSLAMLLTEERERHELPIPVQVFATDLHEGSLVQAREGLYPEDIEADVSPQRLERFFVRENGSYRVRKELREMVLFAPHNLLSDPPFSRLDLISCRNLLIYLNRDLHQQVAELFHYALKPGGFLLRGSSESVDANHLFRAEDKKKCLYRRRNVPGPEPRLPVFPVTRTRRSSRALPIEALKGPTAPFQALHDRILSIHSAPSLLVSPDDDVVQLSVGAGRFVVPPEGPITANVFKLVRHELLIELHAAIGEARRTGQEVRARPVPVRFERDVRPVSLRVQPALDKDQEGFVVVMFEQAAELAPPTEPTATPPPVGATTARLEELEAERRVTEERLQKLIEEHEASQEELKASNEELHSANEELRSTLEELETSREELQSINEELQTVNQENRHKVEELGQLSSDLQNLLVATDIGTLFLDRELRILRFTPKIEELFSVRNTDRGRLISDFTTKLGYDEIIADALRVLENLVPIEHEVQDAAGRWYLTRVLPYRSLDDRIAGVVVTFVDITRQKEAEMRLRLAQQAAERVIESLPQPLLVLTEALEVRTANAAFYRCFKVGPEETVGRRFDELGDGQWNILELRKRLRDIVANDSTIDDYLVEHEFEHIGRRVFLVNGRRLSGMPLVLVGLHDITDRHDMERALRHSEDRLGEENRLKDEYLAMLGHELRNPLGAIRNATELLRRAVLDDPKLLRAHEVLDRQTTHISRIIDGLLDISRIARGKVRLEARPLELGAVLDAVLDVHGPEIEARGLELVRERGQGPVWVDGDEARLAQVFDNIVANAIKFTDPPGRIGVTLERRPGVAVVRVSDTGVGIRPEMLPRIFDAFRQEEQEPARTTGGLGLGLALAKGLVELHHGTITARSEGLGKGTELVVSLPLAKQPAAPAEVPRREPTPRLRVLLVEDNADAALVLHTLLEMCGHDVTSVSTGPRALEILRTREVDIVLCDLGLPGMSGYELAKLVRADPELHDVAMVALTGYGQPSNREQTREAGFDEHLVKPVDIDELEEVLRRFAEPRRG